MADLVAECLACRQWAIRLFGGSIEPREACRHLPAVSDHGWLTFLGAESCARPLQSLLGSAAAELPPDRRSILGARAVDEVTRVMAARAELAHLDRLADRAGISPVVLKGGAAVALGHGDFDLGDLDLLLSASDMKHFEEVLAAEGDYRRDPYQPNFRREGGMVVELQSGPHVGYGVAPACDLAPVAVRGAMRLRTPRPPAHTVYLVQHTTTKHPSRRGHLRDLLLIGAALDACSTSEIDEVERALDASRHRDVYRSTLALAHSFRRHRSWLVADPFERMAALKYSTAIWWPRAARIFVGRVDQTAAFVASPGDSLRLVRGYLRTRDDDRSRWHSPAVARFSTRGAALLAKSARVAYRSISLLYSFGASLRFRAAYALRWRSSAGGTLDKDRQLLPPAVGIEPE